MHTGSFKYEVKQLVSLAWPLLIAQITQTLMSVSDSIMAGRYSSLDMAGVAVGVGITLPVMFFIQGISLALSPQVSRLDGSNRRPDIANWIQQGFFVTVIIAIMFNALFWIIPYLFERLDMENALKIIALDYIKWVFYALPGFAIYQCLRNYCEGLSKTRPTMLIMMIGLVINIPANYIFINGLFGMPEMGGAGCGFATMLVIYSMAIASIIYTLIDKSFDQIGLYQRLYSPNLAKISSILRLGIPIALTLLAEVTLFACSAVLLSPFGATVVAAHQIALSFSALIFQIPLSIGLAVAIRIGFNIGSEQVKSAHTAYKAALLVAISSVVFSASVTILCATWIATIYTADALVINMAASLLIFAAIFQFSDAIQVVGANALRGYKDNKAMLIISICAYWGIGFPTALIFGLTDWLYPQMAAKGFWLGFIIGLTAAAIMMTARVLYVQKYRDIKMLS